MHNTGNPLGSDSILDLYDNSSNIDQYVNSQEDTFPDRFGTKRLTLAGLIKRSMALRNEINDFSGAMTFKPEWTDVPMNVSEGVGGEGGALNLQAEALGNRSEINKITSREALRRTYLEVGLNLVEGSFETGAAITSTTDVVLHEKTGKCYSGPVGEVPKGTDPLSVGFVDKIDKTLLKTSLRSYPIDITDFLPEGYVIDGTVDYTNVINNVLLTYAGTRPVLMPDFPIMVSADSVTGVAVNIPSHTRLFFQPKSKLTLLPNSMPGCSIVAIHNTNNVYIENINISGDKYTHTGNSGEWGMGLSIRGSCNDIIFNNVTIDSCWGDGIYIGQLSDTIESSPSDVYFFGKTTLNKNRRQGVSVISVNGLYFQSLSIYDTKASDSSVNLPNGPCAGIDIEPNSVNSILRGIKIERLYGGGNDGGLFYVFLGAILTSPGDRYHVDIQVGSISDEGSGRSISLMGMSKDARFSGCVVIDSVISNNSLLSPITVRNWPSQCRLPINIGVASLNNWKSSSSNPARHRVAVSIYQATENGYPKIGNLKIGCLNLTSTIPAQELYQSAIFAQNMDGGASDIEINLGYVNTTKLLMVESCGPIKLTNLGMISEKLGRTVSGSTNLYNNVQGDVIVIPSDSNPTLTLPDPLDLLFTDTLKRLSYTKGGTSTYFRIRSGTVPLFVNGVQGTNFLFNEFSGNIFLRHGKSGYFIVCEGSYTKES